MAKPIFIIRVPNTYESKEEQNLAMDIIKNNLQKQLDDYHVIVICEYRPDVECECFNHNLKDIEIEGLYDKLNVTLK